MSIKENIASDSKTISRGGASMELVEVVDQVQQAQHHNETFKHREKTKSVTQ
jgi:hypothetical protein